MFNFDVEEFKMPRMYIVQGLSEIFTEDSEDKKKLYIGAIHLRDHPTINQYVPIEKPIINVLEWHSKVLITPMIKDEDGLWIRDEENPNVSLLSLNEVDKKDIEAGLVETDEGTYKYSKIFVCKCYLNHDFDTIIDLTFKGWSYWRGGKDLNSFVGRDFLRKRFPILTDYQLTTKPKVAKGKKGKLYYYEVTPVGEIKQTIQATLIDKCMKHYLLRTKQDNSFKEIFDELNNFTTSAITAKQPKKKALKHVSKKKRKTISNN